MESNLKLFASKPKVRNNRSNKSQANRLKTALSKVRNGKPSDAQMMRMFNAQTVPMLGPSLQPSNNDIIQSLQEIVQTLHQAPTTQLRTSAEATQQYKQNIKDLNTKLEVSDADMENEIIDVLAPDPVSRRLLPEFDAKSSSARPVSKSDLMFVTNTPAKQTIGKTQASKLVPDALQMSTPISEVLRKGDAAQTIGMSAKRALAQAAANKLIVSERAKKAAEVLNEELSKQGDAKALLMTLGARVPSSLIESPARSSPAVSRTGVHTIPRNLMHFGSNRENIDREPTTKLLGNIDKKQNAASKIKSAIKQKQARDKWTVNNETMKRNKDGTLDQRTYRVPGSEYDLREKEKEKLNSKKQK